MPEQNQLPNSEEAERATLGGVLLDNELMTEVASELRSQDFYWPSCRLTFNAMLQLYNEGKEINPVTIADVVGNRAEKVGGISWLTNLTYGLPHTCSLKTFTDIIKEKSAKRDIAKVTLSVHQAAMADEESSQELLMLLDTKVDPLRENNVSGGFRGFADVAGDVAGKLADLRNGVNPAISTGLSLLDKAIKGGGQGGELHIWAALTGGAKSSMMKQIAQNIAMRGEPVAVITAEMSDHEVFFRMLSPAAAVPAWKIQHGMNTSYLDRLDQNLIHVANLPIWIDDKSTNIFEIKARVKALYRYIAAQKIVVNEKIVPLRVLFVDYLQLLDAVSSHGYNYISNRAQEMATISRMLKKLAKELDIWVFALAQFNRKANEQDEEGMTEPQLHHLAESGKLEQDSDLVGIIDLEKYQVGKSIRSAKLRIVKYRNGPTLTLGYNFNGEYLTFEERKLPKQELVPEVKELEF